MSEQGIIQLATLILTNIVGLITIWLRLNYLHKEHVKASKQQKLDAATVISQNDEQIKKQDVTEKTLKELIIDINGGINALVAERVRAEVSEAVKEAIRSERERISQLSVLLEKESGKK